MNGYKAAQLAADRNRPRSSVERSISLGFTGGLDLKKVFSLGLEAGFTTT